MREKIAFTLALLPFFGGAFLFGLQGANANRIIQGVSIAHLPLGGMRMLDAHVALDAALSDFETQPLMLTVTDKSATRALVSKNLGLSLSHKDTMESAVAIGRDPRALMGLWEQLRALFLHVDIHPRISFDETLFTSVLEKELEGIDEPAKNAELEYRSPNKRFTATQSSSGFVVNRAILRDLLATRVQQLSHEDIALSRTLEHPAVTTPEALKVIPEAEKLAAQAPLQLIARDKSFVVNKEELASLLTAERDLLLGRLVAGAHAERTKNFLEISVSPHVTQETQDAKFKVENGRVVAFALSQEGQELNVDDSVRRVGTGIRAQQKKIELSVTVTKPHITTEDIDTLGIVGLLGLGETDFAGSPKNRMHNIRVGAAKFNGVLLKPGEEFSFARFLGEVTEEAGFKAELVILKDVTTPQLGGGLCQVSTTAFRAAIASGFPITERRAHSYIVRYYGTPGFDATIYPPHPDFRFVNNTARHLLIQTKVQGTKLIFEYFGTNDGRRVEISGPQVYDRKADGSAKATLVVKTTMPDGTVHEQPFNSSYKSPSFYPIARRNPLE